MAWVKVLYVGLALVRELLQYYKKQQKCVCKKEQAAKLKTLAGHVKKATSNGDSIFISMENGTAKFKTTV